MTEYDLGRVNLGRVTSESKTFGRVRMVWPSELGRIRVIMAEWTWPNPSDHDRMNFGRVSDHGRMNFGRVTFDRVTPAEWDLTERDSAGSL